MFCSFVCLFVLLQSYQILINVSFCKRFGPGPYRVKFEIEFHPDEIPEGNGTSFIIEMAPLDLVSIYIIVYIFFLVSKCYCLPMDKTDNSPRDETMMLFVLYSTDAVHCQLFPAASITGPLKWV
jgi:hypothetical protein